MNLFKASLLATALVAAGAASPAFAENNKDFQVLIDIEASCDVISTDDIDFETQVARSGTVNTSGNVVVQCTRDQAYNVRLSGGQTDDVAAREMRNAAGDAISYQLYLDDARTKAWGETDGTDTASGTGTGFGTGAAYNRPHTVFATATLTGTERVGAYSDTVKATVTF